MRKGRLLQIAVAVILTVVLVYFLFKQIDAHSISTAITSVGIWWLLIGFFLYLLSTIVRAARFQLLLRDKIPFKTMLPIVYIQNMANNVLPFFFGELSFLYFCQKTRKTTTGEVTAMLVIARFFDLCAIALLTMVALFFVPETAKFQSLLQGMGIIVLLIFVFFILLLAYKHKALRLVERIAEALHVRALKVVVWFIAKLREATDALESIHSTRVYTLALLSSLAVWVLAYMQAYVLLVVMGYPITFMGAALGSSLSRLTATLPISGIAGFGTTELTWSAAFVLLGMKTRDAIISGFSIHIISLLFAVVLGIIGVIVYGVQQSHKDY